MKSKGVVRQSRDKSSKSRRAVLRCYNLYPMTEADEAVTLQSRIITQRDQTQNWENGQWHDIDDFVAVEPQLLELC